MKRYVINFILILELFTINENPCDGQQMNPPASPTVPMTTQGTGAGPSCNDAAIAALYAMIPDIINGCTMMQTQISQGCQFAPNSPSSMVVILQNIQWQDMLVACDMMIRTKQMADQLQASSGSAQLPASAPISATMGAQVGASPS